MDCAYSARYVHYLKEWPDYWIVPMSKVVWTKRGQFWGVSRMSKTHFTVKYMALGHSGERCRLGEAGSPGSCGLKRESGADSGEGC